MKIVTPDDVGKVFIFYYSDVRVQYHNILWVGKRCHLYASINCRLDTADQIKVFRGLNDISNSWGEHWKAIEVNRLTALVLGLTALVPIPEETLKETICMDNDLSHKPSDLWC